MWKNLSWVGKDNWIGEAIKDKSCIAVTNGSYMKHLFPSIHSAVLVLECSKGRGGLWCSFPEQSSIACSYRGELVGLMAIHLLLLAVNEVTPTLTGSVHIYSNCLRALDKVKHLPPFQIPARWSHSDVLRNILTNCNSLSFDRLYLHVKAHQDDMEEYKNLSRPSQLNCTMDYHSKAVLWNINPTDPPTQEPFPLEPVCVFAGNEKITTDDMESLCFWAHKKLARATFNSLHILPYNVFETLD
jgi:hypothetical protein